MATMEAQSLSVGEPLPLSRSHVLYYSLSPRLFLPYVQKQRTRLELLV